MQTNITTACKSTPAPGYKTTIGITGVSGSDNSHFNSPRGVAVSSSGVVFVADTKNLRLQKCTTSNGTLYTCTTFAGVTGEMGDDFGHLHPVSVAVDKAGRVYVISDWNNRIQVYDANGAYLTSISGSSGSRNGDFRQPDGVAVDQNGYVYVTDTNNHRIQKFAPGVPGWRQININGFGQVSDFGALALEVFNDQLYAATSTWSGSGGRIYRSSTGTDWIPASAPGFGDGGGVPAILDMAVFKGKLYAATGWGNDNNSARIYRTDGVTWEPVVSNGFGNADNNGITVLAEYENWLYAAVQNQNDGVEIWRSATGNTNNWSQVVSGGFNDTHNGMLFSFTVFNGGFYAIVSNPVSGDEVWRTNNGTTWEQVFTDGFGDANNNKNSFLTVFNNQLYASLENDTLGVQLWRSSNGASWEKVVRDGFGDPNNLISPLFVYNGSLYAIARNFQTGLQIWYSKDGTTWHKSGIDGFGDSNNIIWWNNGITFFNGLPIIATWNGANGGEIWQYVGFPIYLPLVRK